MYRAQYYINSCVCVCVAQYVYSEEIVSKIRVLYFHTRNQIYLNLFYHLRSRSYDARIQTNAYRKLDSSYCYFLAFRYLAWWILIATLANATLVQRYWNFFYVLKHTHIFARVIPCFIRYSVVMESFVEQRIFTYMFILYTYHAYNNIGNFIPVCYGRIWCRSIDSCTVEDYKINSDRDARNAKTILFRFYIL